MLRAPGSLNFKSDPPKRCEVYSAEEIRYPLTAFEEFKRTTEIVEFHAENDLVGSAERMCGKVRIHRPLYRKCRNTAGTNVACDDLHCCCCRGWSGKGA